MPNINWSSVKVGGRLVVDGNEFDGVMAAVAFELNAVPQATIAVEIGRGKSKMTPAMIHKVAGQFHLQTTLQLYVTLTPLGGYEQDLPQGEFRLFDGYLVGMSFQKMQGRAQVLLQAKSWLLDMDYSSSLSDTSHPRNPSQFSYRTTHLWEGAGGASWTPFTKQGLIDSGTLASDFWKDGLQPWLEEITKQDAINTDELAFLGEAGSNATAAKALARFTTTKGNYVPLQLDFSGADADSIADAIWADVQAETFESFATHTLWSKLVADFASRYLFAVVPRVEDALVIPFAPGLRTPWKYELKASDYDSVGMSRELSRLLRGIGVFSGLKSRTNADLVELGGDQGQLGIGGWYSPPGISRGMVQLRQGPRWLTNMIATDRYSDFASGGGGARIIGTSLHPGVGAASVVPEPDVLKKSTKRLFDRFAESLYVYEQLRNQQLELGGKVRFDIAPGSTVRVQIIEEPFIQNDQLAGTLIGDVIRVTYNIDSENARIGTNFNVSHVRPESVAAQAGFGLDKHPFWLQPWPGAGLLEQYDK